MFYIRDITRKNGFILFFIALLSAFTTTGCSIFQNNGNPNLDLSTKNRYTSEEDIMWRFSQGHNSSMFLKAHWSNGYPFDCRWSTNNISFDNEGLSMSLTKENDTFYGAEYRTHKRSTYGYYSVSMKPIKKSGVISSFFLYTSYPWWDEIDIEFLGKDTTMVQFNYYHKGKGSHEYYYKLGFDASKEFHEYGFYWASDYIEWYVDGKAVYKANVEIPTSDMILMANVWNVHKDYKQWAGLFVDDNLPVSAKYEWFAYTSI